MHAHFIRIDCVNIMLLVLLQCVCLCVYMCLPKIPSVSALASSTRHSRCVGGQIACHTYAPRVHAQLRQYLYLANVISRCAGVCMCEFIHIYIYFFTTLRARRYRLCRTKCKLTDFRLLRANAARALRGNIYMYCSICIYIYTVYIMFMHSTIYPNVCAYTNRIAINSRVHAMCAPAFRRSESGTIRNLLVEWSADIYAIVSIQITLNSLRQDRMQYYDCKMARELKYVN